LNLVLLIRLKMLDLFWRVKAMWKLSH